MSESSWFFKSAWASSYFRRAPQGPIFICPSPWIFGRPREYQLSDAQAEQLVTRIGRAYLQGMAVVVVGLVVAAAIIGALGAQPLASGFAVAIATVLLIGVCLGIVYHAVGSTLAGMSWTSVPREPYSLTRNFKKVGGILMTLPTWVLAVLVVGAVIPLPIVVNTAYKALASGQLNADVLQAASGLLSVAVFGAVLVAKFRAQRNAE